MIALDLHVRRGAFTLQLTEEIADGITGIVGPSGAGKSTLLAALAGLVEPVRGRIEVAGNRLRDTEARVAVPVHLRRIGMVFQEGLLFPHLSGEANLRYGERLLPPAERRVPFARVIELLRLEPLLGRLPSSLSGGERQRLALGRALLASPRLLLLDEPLSAVDRPHRGEILAGLIAVRDELAIPMLYVSHDLGEVLRLTERLLVLDQGRVVAHGDFTTLAQDPAAAELLMDPVLAARWPHPTA
jgi:molybdate transport system ATP-binding protein